MLTETCDISFHVYAHVHHSITGSSNLISDAGGKVIQHLQYLPARILQDIM